VRALLSVYDKTALGAFAKGLAELGFELVSSGGTATFLEDDGLAVTRVEDVTGFPELLGGRVKTLHPRIHAGILARLDLPEDAAALEQEGIAPFELVCVNLYPFEQGIARQGTSEADAVELIDVGGPSMLRAAAKNFAHVAAVCRPADYEPVLTELRRGKLTLQMRRDLATRAFQATAAYDAAIAAWFADGGADRFPETTVLAFDKQLDLAYGENPHQAGAYYAERGARTHLLARVEQVQGRELSFNNLNDLNAARLMLREFTVPACVIVKHANPCGVALAETVEDAYERALAADPLSAYGGVVVLNRPVSAALGERSRRATTRSRSRRSCRSRTCGC
jgi:phosphoribosylaminoimidazolecarboxamide formyltransferase / IMP cyclohydrolase